MILVFMSLEDDRILVLTSCPMSSWSRIIIILHLSNIYYCLTSILNNLIMTLISLALSRDTPSTTAYMKGTNLSFSNRRLPLLTEQWLKYLWQPVCKSEFLLDRQRIVMHVCTCELLHIFLLSIIIANIRNYRYGIGMARSLTIRFLLLM